MTAAQAEKIVHDYGGLLLSSPILPGCVADTRKLPHPKERIKEALIIALRSTEDRIVRDKIKFSYLSLAEYQDGVGDMVLGVDLTKINLNINADEILRRVVSQGTEMEKWAPVVKADQQALIAELEKHGLW